MAQTDSKDSISTDLPPDGPPEIRRAWFQHALKQHTHPTTGRGWTQADVARDAGNCNEGHVSLVLSGMRKTGEVTKSVQRVVARVLRRAQSELFGVVCKECTNCGTKHEPRRVMKEVGT